MARDLVEKAKARIKRESSSVNSDQSAIRVLKSRGMIKQDGDSLTITSKGRDFARGSSKKGRRER